jgi:cell division protein FtsW
MDKHVDRILLSITVVLMTVGFLIFSSASLGLLAREGARFSSVAFSQVIFGIVGGSIAMFFASQIHYRNWRKYAFYIFILTILLTLLVFAPGLGMSHGGANRWLDLGPFTVQPSEFLKIGFIIYMATYLSGVQKTIKTFRGGTIPFVIITAIAGTVLLIQPDTDTFLIMAASATAMFITAGGRWRDVLMFTLAGAVLLTLLAFTRPYIMDRFTSFMDPELDPQGSGYQVKQSLIAVGSGGVTGRGFGQSIQKFEYLPEPIGDSIFAVFAEEFGFIGSFLLILLFTFFCFRGYKIATHATDVFGMLLVVGFVTLIVTQAFLNIASMLALAPIMGLPLPFISHGGTALMSLLISVGIILNVSKYQKKLGF